MLPFCSAWDTDAWPYHDIQGGSIEELPLTTSRFAGTKNGSDDLLGLGRWCEAGELDWLILVVEENIVHISEGVDMYYIILCIIYRISVVIEILFSGASQVATHFKMLVLADLAHLCVYYLQCFFALPRACDSRTCVVPSSLLCR